MTILDPSLLHAAVTALAATAGGVLLAHRLRRRIYRDARIRHSFSGVSGICSSRRARSGTSA